MRARVFVFLTALAATAAVATGCQLLTGVGDLEIVGADAGSGSDATTTNPPGSDAGTTTLSDGAVVVVLPDGAVMPVDGGNGNPDTGGGSDAATVDSAPPLVCGLPTVVTGTFTPCVKSSSIALQFPTCIEYCRSVGRCCAQNCEPFVTDPSTKAAESADSDEAHCIDPTTEPPTQNSAGYDTCAMSAFDNGVWVKCCCGPAS